MSDKIIAARLQVDTGNSNTEIKGVNKNLSDVKENLKETSTAAKNTGKDVDGTGTSFSNLKGKLASLPGPLGQAGQGVGALSNSFKALIANPVGAVILTIVGALALLYKSFTNTFAGGQQVERIFAGLKAAAGALFDNLDKLGSAIIKVFKFDFSGAVAEIKEVGQAAVDAGVQVAKLTGIQQKLKKEQLQNDLEQAERQKKLAILREQAEDPTISRSKQKQALKELQKEAQENAKADIDLAARTANNTIALLSVGKDAALKNAEEINQVKINQINVETQNANELRRIGKQIASAEREDQAERRAAYKKFLDDRNKLAEEAKARQKEINDAGNKAITDAEKVLESALDRTGQLEKLAADYDKRKELARAAGLDVLKITEAFQLERSLLENKFQAEDDEKQKIREQGKADFMSALAARKQAEINANLENERKVSEASIRIAQEEAAAKQLSLENYSNALNTVSDILGQNTLAGKALAVAASAINTYAAIAGQLKAFAGVPIPGFAIAQAIATGLVGLASIKKIVAVQVPGKSGGGTGNVALPSAAQAAPLSPTRSTTSLDQGSLNQMSNATFRAYVVSADISNDRSRVERLNRAARLG